MPILARNILLPVFMCVEKNASRKIDSLLKEKKLLFQRSLFVTGGKRPYTITKSIAKGMRAEKTIIRVENSNAHAVESVKHRIDSFKADVVIGVGGGVALDVAKYAASLKGVSFISLPTAISNDGISSPIAVIDFNGHTKSLNTHMPIAVVADLSIIRESPIRNTKSGVGDLISNLSACADWRLSHRRKKDSIDDFAETISRSSALRLLSAEKPDINDIGFLKIIIEGLIMSGIAMGIYGSSRPSSGAEHMISHAIDRLSLGKSTHGEQAGVATLFTLALHKTNISDIKRLYKSLSMAENPADLGLSKKDFLKAVKNAPSMRPGRYSILNEVKQKRIEEAYKEAFEEN